MIPPSKDKGKAPTRGSGSNDPRRRALQRALVRHYEKKKRRAELRRMLDDADPLDALQSIDDGPSTDEEEEEEDTSDGPVPGPQDRSEETWDAMIRANEAMSKELTHLRAMNERNDQLSNGATPGASGSRACGGAPNIVGGRAAHTTPVTGGQPALDNPPARLPRRAPSEPEGRGPRHFVPLPKSKTSVTIEDIQERAGLGNDHPRWLEIGNIIRDLMTRVGMDYSNSWLRQDKSQMGILYSLILKEVPELGIFQNGWATEWLVQNKFNNHRYYMGKNRRRQSTSVNDDEPDYHPPPPPPLEPTPPQPARPPSHSDSATRPSPPPSYRRSQPPPPSEPTPPRPSRPLSHSDSGPRCPPDPSTSSQRSGSRDLRPSLSDSRRASLRSSRDGGAAADPTGLPLVNGDPGIPGSRYNLRTRGTAAAAAEAQTTTAVEEANRKRKATGRRTPQRGKKQPRKGELPLLPLEDSDDGARSTDVDP